MLPHFGLAAIELGSVWMLGWLAAAGIPLALHLLHRRRQQEVPWAAMELLLHAIQQNSRTIRIEGWLHPSTANPGARAVCHCVSPPLMMSNSANAGATTQPPKLWVIVLDTSYSMAIHRTRFFVATSTSRGHCSRLASRGQYAFLLIQLAEPSQAVISQPAFDTQRVNGEIGRMKCSDGGGDLNSCLEVLRQTLEDAKQVVANSSDVHIVFITDMGNDTWQPALREPLKREFATIV